jgi:hypothetical protein
VVISWINKEEMVSMNRVSRLLPLFVVPVLYGAFALAGD